MAGDDAEMSAKTIVYLDHTARMGGGEIALLNLVCALNRRRYRPVVVLASDGPLAEKLRAARVEALIVPLDPAVLDTRKDSIGPRSLLHLGRAWACVRYTLRLARLVRRLGADLIHTNSLKSDLYGGAAGRLAGIPVIWHVRDSIDSHYLPPRVAAAFRLLARFLPRAVIANSESTLRTLAAKPQQVTATVYSGVAGSAAYPQVVHDGYDARVFDAGQPLPSSKDILPAMITLVGRIAEWKGQHVFIDAASAVLARFPDTRFQIVGAPLFGEYEYEQSLHQAVAARGLQGRIAFLGFREDVPALLAQATIVVHASTLGEPFGQVVIEGMAAGKPVVATDGGALPEIVLPGETGLLVPMGNAPAMAAAIARLLEDPTRAAQMGAAGRQRVREKFTIAQTVAKVESLYDSLLGLPPAPVRHSAPAPQTGKAQ